MIIKKIASTIKKIIYASGLAHSKLYIKYYRLKRGNENIQHLLEKNRKKRFEKIYENKVWMNKPNARSSSGNGSELENTVNLRVELPKIISRLKITNLLDVGCGDWNWMSQVALPCNYIGIDIVESVIRQNKTIHGTPNKSFIVLDAVVDPLPVCDAVLLREVIFHLSYSDIDRMIKNIILVNPIYVIITSDKSIELNRDIRTGDFRMLNMEREPFFFPKPHISIQDNATISGRYMGIWKVSELRSMYNS
jgi:hypothetical protein